MIVGSYLSLSVALIGVKAKQSNTTAINNSVNNMKLINQSQFITQPNFYSQNSNINSSQSMPLINNN